ncbi:hypothetical protein AYI70_g7859 [Smittium culicis]|uniref:Uncharacterized protein n=1 Tax=Smittium culicis TaxID=133412 RepID=A0A1R1XIP5_9FUNG|nr:hypothetical protein AYI70_g7859 [Smittium culicis]
MPHKYSITLHSFLPQIDYLDKIKSVLDIYDKTVYSHKTLDLIHDSILNTIIFNSSDIIPDIIPHSNGDQIIKYAHIIKILLNQKYNYSAPPKNLTNFSTSPENLPDYSPQNDHFIDSDTVKSELVKLGFSDKIDDFNFTNIIYPLLSKKLIVVSNSNGATSMKSAWP